MVILLQIPQNEMWVVSNSTPCKYFREDDTEFDPESKPKVTAWENTADSVPRKERSTTPK